MHLTQKVSLTTACLFQRKYNEWSLENHNCKAIIYIFQIFFHLH